MIKIQPPATPPRYSRSHEAHDLVPEEVAKRIPAIGAAAADPIVHVKWFTPDSSWTWYVTEYDRAERVAFGLVHGFEKEFGSISLTEIEEFRGPWGLPIERDLHFTPRPVSEFMD